MNESTRPLRLLIKVIKRLPSDSFTHDSFFVGIGLLSNKAPAFLLTIYLANELGAAYFGIFALLKVTLVTLGNLTVAGQHLVLNKIYAQQGEQGDATNFLSLSAAVGISSFLIAGIVLGFSEQVNLIFRLPADTNYSKFLLFGIPLIGWDLVCQAVMVSTRRVRTLAGINAISGVTLVVATFWLVPIFGFHGALWAFLTAVFSSVAMMFYCLLRGANWSSKLWRYIRHPEFKRNGLALGIQEVVFVITNFVFAIILSRSLGFEQYAVYSVIIQWVALSHMGSVIVKNPVISAVTRKAENGKLVLRKAVVGVVVFTGLFAVTISGVITFVDLYPGLVGMQVWLLPVGVLLGLPKQVFGVVWPYGIVLNRSWTVLGVRICRDVVLAVTIAVGVSFIDVPGVLLLEFGIHTLAAIALYSLIRKSDVEN